MERSHLSMYTQMSLLICSCSDSSAYAASNLCGVDRKTARIFFSYFRSIWTTVLRYNPIQFDVIGEYKVDELQVQYVRTIGDQVIPIQWVTGILERESGRVIYYCVPDRTAAILDPQINDSVPHGSIVYSDELSSYNGLDHNFYHFTVNHSQGEYVRIENN